jgi:ribonuclease D
MTPHPPHPELPGDAELMRSDAEIALVAEAAAPAAEVCLDLEADSLHHYREKTCLLQVGISDGRGASLREFLVDPLGGGDLSPLFRALADKVLLMHGADYDLRRMAQDFAFRPAAIFDTMLAARLAGHRAVGFDALAKRYAGVELDHGAQKADWSQRPLPPRLVRYAIGDVHWLPIVGREIRAELAALGRSEWHRQQCAQMILLSEQAQAQKEDPWRIRGSARLGPRALAVLRELWGWREKEAEGWDRPVFMVLLNDRMLELAEWAAAHPRGDLSRAPELPRRWPPRRWKSLRAALERAWAIPAAEHPAPHAHPPRPPFDPQFGPRLDRLKAARHAIAEGLKLDPSILAPNAMLEAICRVDPRGPADFAKVERWLPWQTDVLGPAFLRACPPTGPAPSRRAPR